jgi:L-threonylcarbamoyladenylate synthase
MPTLDGTDAAAIDRAAQALADGALVALPTETVYGLGARADDDRAVAGIYQAKGRPADHPLIVHVVDVDRARHFAAQWPAAAERLARAFWPGPVTVIVPRAAGVAGSAAGGQTSIGLRCPSHPVAQALLRRAAALGVPGVAAPSANRFGRVSPTCAAHVADEFGPDLLVLDGGECEVGIESTIVDCTRAQPALLRPGRLARAELERALGEPLRERDADAPRASGTLEAHYAPSAALRLMDAAALVQALAMLPDPAPGVAVYSRTVPMRRRGALIRPMPADAAAAAHELFAVLRDFDAQGARLIWVEAPPDDPAWEGVADRLRRAAAA